MKKVKLLKPLFAVATTTTLVVPLATLVGCSKGNGEWNLMEEFTPTVKQRKRTSYATVDDVIKTYLETVAEKPEIFAQDMRYTLSRGVDPYVAYVSEYCEIKTFKINMDIDQESITVTNNDTTRTVSFEAAFKIKFDYDGTKYEEMVWYDMPFYAWDSETKVKMVLDFDTRGYDQIEDIGPIGQKKQMTTYAGATQLGVSEKNSTIQIISEKGSYVDLNKIEHKINPDKVDKAARHFILPNKAYWESQGDEGKKRYQELYAESYELWVNLTQLQTLGLIFKYYMPGNDTTIDGAPNTYDFGSYYMGNATLDDLFTATDIDGSTCSLYGFNLSLDSINNVENIKNYDGYDQSTNTFTLPTTIKIDGAELNPIEVTDGAFDSGISKYTNLGLPRDITTLVIPKNYLQLGNRSFAENAGLETIVFEHEAGSSSCVVPKEDAFYGMTSLKTIDFSNFEPANASLVSSCFNDNPFFNVHIGALPPEGGVEGTIKLPNNWYTNYKDAWLTAIGNMGLTIWEEGKSGWKISPEAPSI